MSYIYVINHISKFDINKGSLFTFCFLRCRYQVRNLREMNLLRKYLSTDSLDREFEEDCYLSDVISDELNISDLVESNLIIEKACQQLQDTTKLYFCGISQVEISRKTGKSTQMIYRNIKKDINKFKLKIGA